MAQQGHLQRCPHLIGTLLPRWPQIKPSESHQDLHKRAEALAAGSSEPSARATTAPAQETPVEEPPVMEPPTTETPVVEPPATETPATEAPASDTPRSDTPAPIETGGVGDGQSWAAQVEAGLEAEFQEHRPANCCRSLSRKREARPTLPFPLQDTEGRLTSVLRLYKHVGEQPAPCDDVAGQGIMHLHPEMLPQEARCLGNQVICMIAEYHLTSRAWVSSSLCPVLLEAAKPLLSPIKSYVPRISFEGTRDVRVLDHAKTLRVAVWLHWLDMSIRGDEMASETLEALQHCLGPLLESFLAPTMNNLTFHEVVDRVLHKNQRDAERHLEDLRARCAQIRQELDDLIQAHRESEKSSQKRIKKEINTKHKDLKSLKRHISQCESHLEQDTPGDDTPDINDLLDQGAETEMATALGADDIPSGSAMAPPSDSPPTEGHAMEVDEGSVVSPQASPVSHEEDDLLTGGGTTGVEAGLADLTVSSPRGLDGEGEEASVPEALPLSLNSNWEAVSETASMWPPEKRGN